MNMSNSFEASKETTVNETTIMNIFWTYYYFLLNCITWRGVVL